MAKFEPFILFNFDGTLKAMRIRYKLFCIRFLWKNREWADTRQKYKAMNNAWKKKIERKLK